MYANSSCWLLTSKAFNEISDPTIGFILIYSICMLVQSNSIISILLSEDELLECMVEWLSKHILQAVDEIALDTPLLFRLTPSNESILTCSSMLTLFHITQDSGIVLPVYIILGLCHVICIQIENMDKNNSKSMEEVMKQLIRSGIVSILQQISINSAYLIDDQLRLISKQILLHMMKYSTTVCEQLLDNYLSLALQLQAVPETIVSNTDRDEYLEIGQYYKSLTLEYQKSIGPAPIHRDVDWK